MKEVIGRNISIISKERQLSSINMWCKYVASNMASNVASNVVSNVAKDRLYSYYVCRRKYQAADRR